MRDILLVVIFVWYRSGEASSFRSILCIVQVRYLFLFYIFLINSKVLRSRENVNNRGEFHLGLK
jgi:hypothetical protein